MAPPNATQIGNIGKSKVNQSMASRRSHHTAALSSVSKSKIGGTHGLQTSRTVLSSSRSGKNITESLKGEKGPYKPPVHVVDPETGKDVTPQPLLHLDPNQVRKNQSNILMDHSSQGGTPTDIQSQASIYQGTVNASTMFGGGPFTRSVFSASGANSEADTLSDDAPMDASSHHATAGGITSWPMMQRDTHTSATEDLLPDELDKFVELKFTETDTIWLIDINGTCLPNDTEEADNVKVRNDKYTELCKSRAGNDLYTERGMITFNDAPKLKVVQTDKIGHTDVSLMASNWDMYDTYKMTKELEEAADPDKAGDIQVGGKQADPLSDARTGLDSVSNTDVKVSNIKKSLHKTSTARGTIISRIVQESDIGDSILSIPGHSIESAEDMQKEMQNRKDQEILSSSNFKSSLFIMERTINLNTYQAKLAGYRGFEPCIEKNEGDGTTLAVEPALGVQQGANLERLWAYICSLTKGRNVSCFAWNHQNPDLVAVGYGQYEFVNQKGGLVCCWSLKNPEYPERVFYCEVGATSMDFSQTNPNLLAVGLYDGTIVVYNVKTSGSDPILDTFESNQRHTAPVWQLKWIEKEKGKGDEPQTQEVLISISADGRVCQWTIRKGFECADLMRLKRVQLKQQVGGKARGEKRADSLISRLAGGFCFSFSQLDPMLYIAGTEEGYIHKCSCSYNEQYLDTFEGHGGPVYQLQWSPFSKNVFLSCSADWSIRLWRQDRLKPILSFFSSTKSVNNICWSPYSSTVFACVNDSAVEIWDLSQSTLDPVIVQSSTGPKQTTLTFAHNSETILVGDSSGQVMVYQLKNMPAHYDNQEEALNRIIAASLASQLQEEDNDEPAEQPETPTQ